MLCSYYIMFDWRLSSLLECYLIEKNKKNFYNTFHGDAVSRLKKKFCLGKRHTETQKNQMCESDDKLYNFTLENGTLCFVSEEKNQFLVLCVERCNRISDEFLFSVSKQTFRRCSRCSFSHSSFPVNFMILFSQMFRYLAFKTNWLGVAECRWLRNNCRAYVSYECDDIPVGRQKWLGSNKMHGTW